ncbi:MAG: type II toxin-antitoxin system Phd/YefM family antitoxin [Eggerthellaceae bacterium]|nr:type II toxin-antitoxin system Phd/YefM family antitoxin [Eggerthellaceae bacterium]
MKQVNMHEAKTHLSSLVEDAVLGEPFIIAKSGTPQVIVYSYYVINEAGGRTGFMPEIQIPDNFNTLDQEKIAALFNGTTL